jgi:hypothetical protein
LTSSGDPRHPTPEHLALARAVAVQVALVRSTATQSHRSASASLLCNFAQDRPSRINAEW